LKPICSAAGFLMTLDSIAPPPRFRTTDWPLKMPKVGAVTIVVTPVERRASASASTIFALRRAKKSGAGSEVPSPRFGVVKPIEVCASIRPG
jgi:hypothetical protein